MLLPKPLVAALVSLLAAGSAFAQAPGGGTPKAPAGSPGEAPKNVVLMIADGTGPATFTMARDFERWRQEAAGKPGAPVRLAIDSLKLGSIQTFSTNSRVTDSAAGATAFSTGHKTYNGAIAVDTARRPLATLLEAARQRGMATGLVATSRITHATPASFASHTPDRDRENEIARQMLAHQVDLLYGGGRRHFRPAEDGGARADGRDLLQQARETGYTVVEDRAAFEQADTLPVLGLFAKSHLPFAIDRDTAPGEVPTLAAMAKKALRLLSESEKGRANGIFLMVEGSRIDHAGHDNDAAAHVREALAYDEAVAQARRFAEQDGQTLLLSTADHETGGLTLGRDGDYAWKPAVLEAVDASHGPMVEAMTKEGQDPAEVLRRHAGITDLTDDEQQRLAGDVAADRTGALGFTISDIIGRRARVGWTTGGHTAVDVGVYGMGPGHEHFAGHHDNTFIGSELAQLMGFDLSRLTAQLRQQQASAEASTAAGGE